MNPPTKEEMQFEISQAIKGTLASFIDRTVATTESCVAYKQFEADAVTIGHLYKWLIEGLVPSGCAERITEGFASQLFFRRLSEPLSVPLSSGVNVRI